MQEAVGAEKQLEEVTLASTDNSEARGRLLPYVTLGYKLGGSSARLLLPAVMFLFHKSRAMHEYPHHRLQLQ